MNTRLTQNQLETEFNGTIPSEQVDCHSLVMSKIQAGRVKMRSRWIVLTEYLGLRTTWFVLVLSLIALINLDLYIISRSEAMDFIDFGWDGYVVFFKNLPFGLWALAFLILAIVVFAIKRFSVSYFWPFHLFASLFVLGIFGASAGTFASGLNDMLYQKFVETPGGSDSLLGRIYCRGANTAVTTSDAMSGEVMEVSPRRLVIQTPSLDVVTVFVGKHLDESDLPRIKQFDVVKMIGERQNQTFFARTIKLDDSQNFVLRRDHEDCGNEKRWEEKQKIVEKRRQAVQSPFSPNGGLVQLMRSMNP